MNGNRNCVVNQFKLALNPASERVDVEPGSTAYDLYENLLKRADLELPHTDVRVAINGRYVCAPHPLQAGSWTWPN